MNCTELPSTESLAPHPTRKECEKWTQNIYKRIGEIGSNCSNECEVFIRSEIPNIPIPEERNGFWKLFECAGALAFYTALDFGSDRQVILKAQELQKNLCRLLDTLWGFRRSPGAKIKGSQGAAEQVKKHTFTIYQRIKRLGLTPNDFRNPKMSLDDLIEKSPHIQLLARDLLPELFRGKIARMS